MKVLIVVMLLRKPTLTACCAAVHSNHKQQQKRCVIHDTFADTAIRQRRCCSDDADACSYYSTKQRGSACALAAHNELLSVKVGIGA
jgi:hypothetical protein